MSITGVREAAESSGEVVGGGQAVEAVRVVAVDKTDGGVIVV